MIQDEVSVYNLALNAVGARNNLTLTTENSREAEVCRLWYAVVRDQILAAASWPEARAFSRLANVGTVPDDGVWLADSPEPNFLYSFEVPSDMLRPRFLASYGRFTLTSRSATEVAINCNEETPILCYTRRLERVSLWDSELQMAVVYGLAANICMPLTGKPVRAKNLLEQANALVLQARQSAANSDDSRVEVLPDWLAVRGGANVVLDQYVYPHGALLTVMGGGVN